MKVASERNAYKRGWFWRRVKELVQAKFRFIDETGVNVTLTRLFGRAPRGERVSESVPKNYRQQTSIISCMSLSEVTASFVVEGAVDTEVFNVYVEKVLRPTIEEGDIFILDNLTAHHASCIERVAAECKASVLWLSPYSPDFSPIELLWLKIKTSLRKAKARTVEQLSDALTKALGSITENDCLNWFTHCGYKVATI